MPEFEPSVSLVIPAYNAAGCLDECLESIKGLEYPAEKLETLIVDNNSTDSTPDIIRRHGFAPLSCERPGASAARNAGIAKAQGEIVAFTDSDTVVDPDWLARLVQPFREPNIGGVGGQIAPYSVATGAEAHAAACGILDQEKYIAGRPPHMLPFAATANAAFRALALREIGGFDEELAVCEDADLSWRIQWAGHRLVYVEDARVRHKHRSSRAAYFRQTYQYGRATVDLFAKHHRQLGLRTWIAWPHLLDIGALAATAPFRMLFGRNRGERIWPLYNLAAALSWTAGRVVRSFKRRVFVI
jgi:cellulose synthase/poly-beta-1,6-N-acetylglucosamine synthase-like glycosyltransferase